MLARKNKKRYSLKAPCHIRGQINKMSIHTYSEKEIILIIRL